MNSDGYWLLGRITPLASCCLKDLPHIVQKLITKTEPNCHDWPGFWVRVAFLCLKG